MEWHQGFFIVHSTAETAPPTFDQLELLGYMQNHDDQR